MAGVTGLGSKLFVKVDSTWTHVAHLVTIGAITGTTDEVETTDLDSDAKEFVAGDTDYGSVAYTGNFVDGKDKYTTLQGLLVSKETVEWAVIHPTVEDACVYFEGYVSEHGTGERSRSGVLNYNGNVRVSGAVTDIPEADRTAIDALINP